MNRKFVRNVVFAGFVILGIVGLQLLLTNFRVNSTASESAYTNDQSQGNVEKIQVVHFHATLQCWTCSTVGEFARKTVTDSFTEEFKRGKIEFLDINIDLPENDEIVKRFGATGSSLYINVIRDGKDSISEDVKVWQLVSDEQKYISYLEDKLNGFLK